MSRLTYMRNMYVDMGINTETHYSSYTWSPGILLIKDNARETLLVSSMTYTRKIGIHDSLNGYRVPCMVKVTPKITLLDHETNPGTGRSALVETNTQHALQIWPPYCPTKLLELTSLGTMRFKHKQFAQH